jgi:hypothetical protein
MAILRANYLQLKKVKYFIAQKSDQPFWLFLGFWLVTILFYALAYKGGFSNDLVDFLYHFRIKTYAEFVSPPGHSMYLGVNTIQYLLIYLFGRQPLPWFLVFTGLHALTALTLARFFRNLFLFWEGTYSKWVILTGTLFWLLTPLAVETVTWKACSHYMCSMIMMFSILSWFIKYLQTPKVSTLLGILFVFALSTVFLELFFLTPVFLVIILVTAAYCNKLGKNTFAGVILKVLVPISIIWGLYFLLSDNLNGQSYDRYLPKSENVFNPLFISGRVGRYVLHIYFMEYFLPINMKRSIYNFLDKQMVSSIFGLLVAFLLLWSFFRMRKASAPSRLLSVLFLLFIASFIILLPMWFYEEFSSQGGRYFYLSGAFGYMLLACIIFRQPFAFNIRLGIAGAYLCCCMAGTLYLVKNVRDTERILSNLFDSFGKWEQKGDIYLLNLPIYHRGVGLIGAADSSNFVYHLDVLRDKKVKANVYDVSSFNMIDRWDGAHVQVVDSMQVKVTLNQYGSWWWYKFQGASDYENEKYKVTFVNNGFSYLIQFKQPMTPASVILFQSGGLWKEVDMSKKEEQW